MCLKQLRKPYARPGMACILGEAEGPGSRAHPAGRRIWLALQALQALQARSLEVRITLTLEALDCPQSSMTSSPQVRLRAGGW